MASNPRPPHYPEAGYDCPECSGKLVLVRIVEPSQTTAMARLMFHTCPRCEHECVIRAHVDDDPLCVAIDKEVQPKAKKIPKTVLGTSNEDQFIYLP